jgi:hypothetical protein
MALKLYELHFQIEVKGSETKGVTNEQMFQVM